MTDSNGSSTAWPWWWGKVWGWIHRNPASNRVVVEVSDLSAIDRVLDVGCGAGAALVDASRTVTEGMLAGIDPTTSLAQTASKRLPAAEIKVAGADDIPFPPETFTVVWSISSLHHWPAHQPGLSEILRVLAPGGRLLVAERLLPSEDGHGISRQGLDLLADELADAGYIDVDWRTHPARRRQMAIVTAYRPA